MPSGPYLRFFQMWQSLFRLADANTFNIFCAQLVKSECITLFKILYHHLSDMQQWLDMKGLNSEPLFQPPAFTTLTEVHIAPFSNALINWFVRSANASPVKRLSLGGFLGQRHCAIPICHLHLPHLGHLTILGGLFTMSEMSSFLSNEAHSSLESISFSSVSQLLSEMDTQSEVAFPHLPPNKGLPNLTTIAANSGLLLSFLPALEMACPNFEHVDALLAGWKEELGEECWEVLSAWIPRAASSVWGLMPELRRICGEPMEPAERIISLRFDSARMYTMNSYQLPVLSMVGDQITSTVLSKLDRIEHWQYTDACGI